MTTTNSTFMEKQCENIFTCEKYQLVALPPRTVGDITQNYIPVLPCTVKAKEYIYKREQQVLLSSLSEFEQCVHYYIRNIDYYTEIPKNIEEIIERLLKSGKSFSDREIELDKKQHDDKEILSTDENEELDVCYHLRNFTLEK